MKIVGFILRSDLKTSSNTAYIVKKAYGRLWILRRLKALGASRTRLLDVLQKQILSVLNLGVPAWDCLLTEQEKVDLERVLKTGLKIIWGQHYTTSQEVFREANVKTLAQVRENIVKKFVKKSRKHKKFSRWFVKNTAPMVSTRAPNRTQYKPVYAKKAFYKKSPIPVLTSMANTQV